MTESVKQSVKPANPYVAPSAPVDEVHFNFLKHLVLPVFILLVGIAGLMGSAKLKKEPSRKEIPPYIPTVQTMPVESFDGQLTMDVDGTVVPLREVDITTEVGGRIKTKNAACRAGNFVQQGTLLFEIDSIDFELEVKRLEQEVVQAEIGIQEMDVQLSNYRQLMELAAEDRELQLREIARLRSMVTQRVVTESELDRARSTEVVKRNSLQTLANQVKVLVPRRASLEATLALAKTRLEKAQLDLSRTRIVAPVDGIVISDMVEENSFVARGAMLTSMEDTSSAEVRCNLRTDQLVWLWSGASDSESGVGRYEVPPAKARVIFRIAGREYEWDAVLARFEGTGIDERTRTVPCRVLVENPTEVRLRNDSPGMAHIAKPPALVRGMFVTVEIDTETSVHLLRIPLVAQQLGGTVWVADDGRLRVESVDIAKRRRDYVLVDAGSTNLKTGDPLIVTPIANVEDGMEILLDKSRETPFAALANERPLADDETDNQPANESYSL